MSAMALMNWQNRLHTLALVVSLGALAAGIGYLAAGPLGVVIALGLMAVSVFVRQRAATVAMLRHLGARFVPGHAAPELARLLAALSHRAGLPMPHLFVVPLPVPQAMAMGSAQEPMVAVSPPLLQRLTPRQIAAVLAHELSHLRHGDLVVMRLADTAVAVTRTLATLGLLGAVVAALAGVLLPLWSLALLYLAPAAMLALRQALSRTREFAADAGAAALTGDPLALAEALQALEHRRSPWGWLVPVAAAEEDWLASHPATPARVARLRALARA